VTAVFTWYAAVGGLEVRDKVLTARLDTEQFGIRHRDDTARPAATSKFDVVEHIGKTPDVVVDGQTPSDPHTAIASCRYQNYFIYSRTCGVKCLPLTVFLHCRS